MTKEPDILFFFSDQLFNLADDPDELHNRAAACPDVVQRLMVELEAGWDPDGVVALCEEMERRQVFVAKGRCGVAAEYTPAEKWPIPAELTRVTGP